MRLMTMKLGTSLLKVGAAGATIFGIAWGMMVLQPQPSEPVATAEADIAFFNFGPKSDQQKFVDSLLAEGLEKPRAYDHNGNKLFFSTTTTSDSPRQVLERMQRRFVETGLNDAVHLSPPAPVPVDLRSADLDDPRVRAALEANNGPRKKWMNDYLGGVVPTHVDDHSVMMAGATSIEGSEDGMAFAREVLTARKDGTLEDLGQAVKAMRYVDAVREGSGKTRITAIWSDEEYDVEKIANIAEPGEELGVDPEIPVCPGCERLMHMRGETEKDYGNHAFRAPGHAVDQSIGFYRASLPGRGWKLSEATGVMKRAQLQGLMPPMGAQMLNFSRGGEFLTVVAWEQDGSTKIHIARSN